MAENLREKELEMVCTEQAAKIEQLNHLVMTFLALSYVTYVLLQKPIMSCATTDDMKFMQVEQYKIEFDRRSNGDIGIRKNEVITLDDF